MNWNNKAWEVLLPEEQMAITLSVVQNMSTLKAGEIMAKSHYKFLEILDRAKAFLRIFNEWFNVHDDLVPSYIRTTDEFRQYITLTIYHRKSPREASMEMNFPFWVNKGHRDNRINWQMVQLNGSKKLEERSFAIMVRDFDRWNNYRILPYEVQDPSAFKRRNKNLHIKFIKHILSIHPYSAKKIRDRFEFKAAAHNSKPAYMVSLDEHGIAQVFRIEGRGQRHDHAVRHLSKIGIYVFRKEADAELHAELIRTYANTDKDCKFGQSFWPKYRLNIQQSLNYGNLMKLIPSRKHFSDALKDFDEKYAK